MKTKLCAIFAIFVLAASLFAGCKNVDNVNSNPDDVIPGAEDVNRRHDRRDVDRRDDDHYGINYRTTVHGRYNDVNHRDGRYNTTDVHGRYDDVNHRGVIDNRNVNRNHIVITTTRHHNVYNRTRVAAR